MLRMAQKSGPAFYVSWTAHYSYLTQIQPSRNIDVKNFKIRFIHLCIACLCLMSVEAWAGENPLIKGQAPGYYRQQVGDLIVTALYDGYMDIPSTVLHGIPTHDIEKLMSRMFVQDQHGVQTAVNAFLVQTTDHLVLVDTGSSTCNGPAGGKVLENLRAAGFDRNDVSTVLLTHLHPDHACGILTPQGTMAFPNATVWAAKKDADHWLSPAALKAASERDKSLFTLVQNAVAPYEAKGSFHAFIDGNQLPSDFHLLTTPGHTPGHSSYLVSSAKESVLIWGDLVHSHSVQMAHPEVSVDFDSNPSQAIDARRRILKLASEKGWLVAGAHLPFPGLGHVRSETMGYSWIPVEYSPVRTDR